MADAHRNFAKGTLTNSPGTAGTSFVLGTGEGALFAANMPVTIVPAQTQPDSTNAEIGYITAVATDTLTITRAQQSTTAKNAQAGWLVLGTITAKALTDIETDVATKAATTYVDTEITAAKSRANHTGTQTASTISDFNTAADARITAATGVSVQAYDADLTTWGGKTAPSGTVVGTSDTQTLTNKTLDQPLLLGGSSVPSTPSAGVGKIYGAGTGAVSLRYMNSTGTEYSLIPENSSGTNAGSGGGTTNYIRLGNIAICWGLTNASSTLASGGTQTLAVTFPVTFSSSPTVTASSVANTGEIDLTIYQSSAPTTTSVNLVLANPTSGGGSGTGRINWIAIGPV